MVVLLFIIDYLKSLNFLFFDAVAFYIDGFVALLF